MPASETTERRNERMTMHEPPKLKTTLKTPPKQATNPLQFVKVGPCSLYRTAQEQLQKVQEVKKIKQEIRDDPEDWQSNLDNWKSSRRKRQEHIIERVVEVKKLELEEHDRQRRRSKTFSEMMEERGNRGRKLSLAMYHEEDANDLSDLGIGTSSGKSSISGDTHDSHDDTHSILSDKDIEVEKSHSEIDNINDGEIHKMAELRVQPSITSVVTKRSCGNGYRKDCNEDEEFVPTTSTSVSSLESEEYTYESAIRGYVSRVSQNIGSKRFIPDKEATTEEQSNTNSDTKSCIETPVKINILKRREIFEKASQKQIEANLNNRLVTDFVCTKSVKEKLSTLERQASTNALNYNEKVSSVKLSGNINSVREKLSRLEKENTAYDNKTATSLKPCTDNLESNINSSNAITISTDTCNNASITSILSTINTNSNTEELHSQNGIVLKKDIKGRLPSLETTRKDLLEKKSFSGITGRMFNSREQESRIDTSTPSERSSSPDSEYRVPRTVFHRSLDSLDADASSGPDTFERVQSLEELDYGRQYLPSLSSTDLLNDTDREDSGIHTADVSCSVSQADEPIDEDILHTNIIGLEKHHQEIIQEEESSSLEQDNTLQATFTQHNNTDIIEIQNSSTSAFNSANTTLEETTVTSNGTAEALPEEQSINKPHLQIHPLIEATSNTDTSLCTDFMASQPIAHQNGKLPSRRLAPLTSPKLKLLNTEISANEFKSNVLECKLTENFLLHQVTNKKENEDSNIIADMTLISLPTSSSSLANLSTETVSEMLIINSSLSSAVNFLKSTYLRDTIQSSKSTQSPLSLKRSVSKIPTLLQRKSGIQSASIHSSASSSSSIISPSKGFPYKTRIAIPMRLANNSWQSSSSFLLRTPPKQFNSTPSSPISTKYSLSKTSSENFTSKYFSLSESFVDVISTVNHVDNSKNPCALMKNCEKVMILSDNIKTPTPFITLNRVENKFASSSTAVITAIATSTTSAATDTITSTAIIITPTTITTTTTTTPITTPTITSSNINWYRL